MQRGEGGARTVRRKTGCCLDCTCGAQAQRARSGEGLPKRKGQEETHGMWREGLRRKRQRWKCHSALLLTLQKVQKSRVARIGGSPRATQPADSMEKPRNVTVGERGGALPLRLQLPPGSWAETLSLPSCLGHAVGSRDPLFWSCNSPPLTASPAFCQTHPPREAGPAFTSSASRVARRIHLETGVGWAGGGTGAGDKSSQGRRKVSFTGPLPGRMKIIIVFLAE